MERRTFLKLTAGGIMVSTAATAGISTLRALAGEKDSSEKMPVLFVGHGNPMNAIEQNAFSMKWQEIGKALPKPKAILCVSAHWLTKGTKVTAMERPKTIHDFGGFPQELFDVQYPAPGSPEVAKLTQETLAPTHVQFEDEWGFDHGSWSVLKQMYPDASIPLLQLSIDYTMQPEKHYEIAQQLAKLRTKGVMIVSSGNLVHNLRAMRMDGTKYDWALEFDQKIANLLDAGDDKSITRFQEWGDLSRLAHPTYEHLLPVFYTLGAKDSSDKMTYFNEDFDLSSVSMRSMIYA